MCEMDPCDRGSSSNLSNSVDGGVVLDRDSYDAVIKVDGDSFPINKLHLSICSQYFRALLLSWSTPDTEVFEIRGISSEGMRLVIDFFNSGFVSVTEENLEELYIAADYFLVTDIIQVCSDFLGERLGPENCVRTWKLADIYLSLSPELRCRAYRCIIDHFYEVVSSEQFQQLPVQQLIDLLVRDDLNVRESRLLEAIPQWVAHAPEERTGTLTVLLSKVRLVVTDHIRIGMSNELLSLQIPQNFKLQMDLSAQRLTVCCKSTSQPRTPNAILLAIGGRWYGVTSGRFDAYDIRADHWVKVAGLQQPERFYHGTAVLDDCIYCVGGMTGLTDLDSVERFDMKTHTWHEAAPMKKRRRHVSVAALNGYLYAMGGESWGHRHMTAERYSPETNQWSMIARMKEGRSRSSCTTLNNKVYICGGRCGIRTLNTCEYYSPETNQWTMFTPMGSERQGLGIIAYADQIFAVGGEDGLSVLCSVEAYNPQTDAWHEVCPMFSKRSHFGIGVINNEIFAVGGDTSTTEYYDAKTGQWFPACDVEFPCLGLSCCVVPRLPNMAMCTIPHDDLPCLNLE